MEYLKDWYSLLREIGFPGLLDIAVVTLVIYTFLIALKRTQRSRLIFAGVVILGGIYLAARKMATASPARCSLMESWMRIIAWILKIIIE